MTLSDKSIQEFQAIMKDDYGQELSKEKAGEFGERLINLYELLIKIDKRENGSSHTKNPMINL